MRLLLGFTFISISASVQARPVFLNELRSAFPNAPLTARCNNCHKTGGPQLNPFGKEFGMLRRELGPARMMEVWARLRSGDSDKDGVDNETELNADRNPGVAESASGIEIPEWYFED